MKWEGMSSGEKAMPATKDEDEEEDTENVAPEEDDELAHSESDEENESKKASENDEGEDVDDSRKDKQDKKSPPKKQNSSKKKMVNVEGSSKKTPSVTAAKSPSKTPSSTRSKSDERNDEGEKVFVPKKKQVDLPKKESTSNSDVKEKSSGKRGAGGNHKPEGAGQSNPSKEDLRKTICEILKKVDINTTTFTDILKQLATHYKVDLTPRKATIKLMIQEELTKLADEIEENKDDGDSEKEEHRKDECKKDSPKSLKRKRVARGTASKGTEDVPKKSRKKRMKWEGILSSGEKAMPDTEDEDEEEDNDNVAPEEDEKLAHSFSDKENESKEASEKDKGEDVEDSRKDKQDKKSSPKKQNYSKKKKVNVEGRSKKTPSVTAAKSPSKTPSSTRSKPDECNDEGEKVFVRKKKQVDLPKKKSTSKSDVKEKSSGKRGAGGNPKPEGAGQSNPSKEDLRKTICEILKKADFNTTTFTDVLKQLATNYKVDLTRRKETLKLLIHEELTKLADEAEENKDDGDSEKEEHRKAEGKKVEV